MAAAVPLAVRNDFSLAEARLAWNRSLHLRHEIDFACREARQLSLQISAQLQAQLLAAPADLRALARSLHIPHPSLRRLLALADPAPPPPTLTLTGCDFSLRLDPPEWALARRSLELLTCPGQPPFDISRSIADAFTSHTHGPLRDQLRHLHRAHPLDFLPERVAALPPLSAPAPMLAQRRLGVSRAPEAARAQAGCAAPAAQGPAPMIEAAWRRLQVLRRGRRAARAELAELCPRLARLIFAQWRTFAHPGPSSVFSAWLLMVGIPRSSAYRLLRQFHPTEGDYGPTPMPAQDLNCPESGPVATVHQGKLLVRLTLQHAAIVHAALTGLIALAHPFNPAAIVVSHLASCVPLTDRPALDSLYRSPPTGFPRFLPPLRIFPPPRGAPA